MKHIEIFELNQYTEKELKQYKMTYSQVGKAWNSLWNEYKFFYPGQKFFTIKITMKYDDDNDIGYFEVLRYSKDNKSYINIGDNFFRGISEDRVKFINWLDELHLITKK